MELYTGPYGGCYDNPEEAARQVDLLGLTADAAKAEGGFMNGLKRLGWTAQVGATFVSLYLLPTISNELQSNVRLQPVW